MNNNDANPTPSGNQGQSTPLPEQTNIPDVDYTIDQYSDQSGEIIEITSGKP